MSETDQTSQSEQALQDYLDDLFGGAPALPVRAERAEDTREEPLVSRRPVSDTTSRLREFADPPKRLARPLPPVAPPAQAKEVSPPPTVVAPAPVAVSPPPVAAPVLSSAVQTVEVPIKQDVSEAVRRIASRRIVVPAPVAPPPVVQKAEVVVAPPVVDVPPAVVVKPVNTWAENGRPHWAQTRFECLMFKVGGLMLAVPLVDLGTIQRMTDALTPIFGQADWFMGIMPVNQVSMRVVNTAKIVMPERYTPDMLDGYSYVITLFDSHWGLAADGVAESITLQPDQVRWRTQRAKRAWLAGTVVDHMCALLDVGALKELLSSADRPRAYR